MDQEALVNRLKTKPDLNLLIAETIKDASILDSLFEIILTETSSVKYVCTKIIRMVSEQKPELIYPYFEEISRWLRHINSFIKWDGILTLSNLSAVDPDDRFGSIYEDYFALIHDQQMMTAANVIGNAWKIALARPDLESDITRRLLAVPKMTYLDRGEPSPECNRIACGHVLDCFEHYFDDSKNQAVMIHFAEGQLESHRKAVARKAACFLKRHASKR